MWIAVYPFFSCHMFLHVGSASLSLSLSLYTTITMNLAKKFWTLNIKKSYWLDLLKIWILLTHTHFLSHFSNTSFLHLLCEHIPSPTFSLYCELLSCCVSFPCLLDFRSCRFSLCMFACCTFTCTWEQKSCPVSIKYHFHGCNERVLYKF